MRGAGRVVEKALEEARGRRRDSHPLATMALAALFSASWCVRRFFADRLLRFAGVDHATACVRFQHRLLALPFANRLDRWRFAGHGPAEQYQIRGTSRTLSLSLPAKHGGYRQID